MAWPHLISKNRACRLYAWMKCQVVYQHTWHWTKHVVEEKGTVLFRELIENCRFHQRVTNASWVQTIVVPEIHQFQAHCFALEHHPLSSTWDFNFQLWPPSWFWIFLPARFLQQTWGESRLSGFSKVSLSAKTECFHICLCVCTCVHFFQTCFKWRCEMEKNISSHDFLLFMAILPLQLLHLK